MFIIEKSFSFSASHQLQGLPDGHPCRRNHGHNYVVKFTLKKTTLDEIGFVKDYRSMDSIKIWIDETLDHRFLNEMVTFNPTAERLAQFFYDKFIDEYEDLASVTVMETEKTAATYEPFLIEHRKPIFTR